MAIVVWGTCDLCNDGAEKRLVSRKSGLCLLHYRKEGKGIRTISDKQKAVLKKDSDLYQEIWSTRPHKSEVSDKPLGEKQRSIFFSHILCKKNYPRFRHNPENIILMTPQEHHDWEFADRNKDHFKVVREREEILREQYKETEL